MLVNCDWKKTILVNFVDGHDHMMGIFRFCVDLWLDIDVTIMCFLLGGCLTKTF